MSLFKSRSKSGDGKKLNNLQRPISPCQVTKDVLVTFSVFLVLFAALAVVTMSRNFDIAYILGFGNPQTYCDEGHRKHLEKFIYAPVFSQSISVALIATLLMMILVGRFYSGTQSILDLMLILFCVLFICMYMVYAHISFHFYRTRYECFMDHHTLDDEKYTEEEKECRKKCIHS